MSDQSAVSLTPAERAICAKIAAEITEHPERWTQGEAARDASLRPTYSNSSAAVCWCALGFIRRECVVDDSVTGNAILEAFEAHVRMDIAEWNDTCSAPSEVAAVFAKLAEAPQS